MNYETNVPEEQGAACVEASDGKEPAVPKTKKTKKKLVFLIGAIVLVLALAVVGIVLLRGNGGTEATLEKQRLFAQGLLAASTDGKWGYIDKTGKYVINPQFDEASPFAENGLARVASGEKYGFIDETGKYVINPQFDWASFFAENGLACVNIDEKWGYIDKTGKYVINPQFDRAYSFQADIAVVQLGDKYGLINAKGEYIVNPKYTDMAHYTSNGYLYFADDDGKIGYLNTAGKEKIAAQFEYLSSYGTVGGFYADGYAVVRVGDALGVIDKTGAYLVNPQFDGLGYWSVDD